MPFEHRPGFDKKTYRLEFEMLPKEFDGLKIIHLSDLHSCHVNGLEQAIFESQPDIICCSGDLYDGVASPEITDEFLVRIKRAAPVFFVSGNHELYSKNWKQKREWLKEQNIYLEDEVRHIQRGSDRIEICGIQDPDFSFHWSYDQRLSQLEKSLKDLPEKENFRITLFHRADLAEKISSAKSDVILSGHLHGGQIRLFGKGVLRPNDGNGPGFFPAHDGGCYPVNGSILVVSRGLGDHMAVPRLFNPPELVEIILTKTTRKGE